MIPDLDRYYFLVWPLLFKKHLLECCSRRTASLLFWCAKSIVWLFLFRKHFNIAVDELLLCCCFYMQNQLLFDRYYLGSTYLNIAADELLLCCCSYMQNQLLFDCYYLESTYLHIAPGELLRCCSYEQNQMLFDCCYLGNTWMLQQTNCFFVVVLTCVINCCLTVVI